MNTVNTNRHTNRHTTGTDERRSGVVGLLRTRWAAVGAAVAVSIGGGGIGLVHATVDSGERPVLVPLDEPCRLTDTRPDTQVGPRNTPIGADETYTIDAWGLVGECDLTAEATALATNVTAVNATQQTNLRFFGGTGPVPNAANMNPGPGQPPAPNAVTVDLDDAGQFSVFNKFGTVDVVIDVIGHYEHHNHDDAYVQLEQIMWVVVDTDGSIDRMSRGVDSAERLDEGDYRVTFDRDISNCVYQATVGRPGTNTGPTPGFAMVANWTGDPTDSVAVFTKLHDGTSDDHGFHLTVTCTPTSLLAPGGLETS